MADRNTPRKETRLLPYKMAANAVIGAGKIVCAAASGYATKGAVAATLTYLGISDEAKDNTGGANGDLSINVRTRLADAHKLANSGSDPVTIASIGKVCYIEDDQTVSATSASGARSACGIVVAVDSDGVWVQ